MSPDAESRPDRGGRDGQQAGGEPAQIVSQPSDTGRGARRRLCPDCAATVGPNVAHAPGCPIGSGMDRSGEKDAAYFKAHPDQRTVLRGLHPEEAAALRCMGWIVDPHAMARVTVLGPGVRTRRWWGVWSA